jgi:site-specific DNA-adenine methylase
VKPFFCFYGGKYRAAPHYPSPRYDIIIEPFAGAAGYSTRHHEKQVFLCDADPVIAGLWKYLTKVSSNEIMSLPTSLSSVDDIKGHPQEAKHLIGFWMNKGSASPCKTPSAWMRSGIRSGSYWGSIIRERIASQVDLIRHWRVFHGDYSQITNMEATWFIDPPYQQAGKHYRYGEVDYSNLRQYCLSRSGQVIVCENQGADWLPFRSFADIKATPGKRRSGLSKEVAYFQ